MKNIKSIIISFTLIIYSFFLCACGVSPQSIVDLNKLAEVDISGTYIESSIDELNPYITNSDPSYIGNTATGYKLSIKDVVPDGELTYNYIFKINKDKITKMARNTVYTYSEEGETLKYECSEYLKNDIYYFQDGEYKYYINKTSEYWDLDTDFDFDINIIDFASSMLTSDNLIITKAVEGTTIKFKASLITSEIDKWDDDDDGDTTDIISTTEVFVLVIKNGNFSGMYYSYENDSLVEKSEVNIIAITENIGYPSNLSEYEVYNPEIHVSFFSKSKNL